MTKRIPLNQGKFALVDDDWYEYLSQWKWSLGPKGQYAIRHEGKQVDGKWVCVRSFRMHRVIMRAKRGQSVDHINGNTLDNRKRNLRFCTHAENLRNHNHLNSNNTSGYRGTHYRPHAKMWCASITVNYQSIFLGYFEELEDAAQAYDDAAKFYHGEFATLNFK